MAKDLLVSIGIGAAMQAGAGAVFGRTRKYLAGLGKAIEANERQAGRIEAYRALEARLGKTRTTAREATERGSSPLARGTPSRTRRAGRCRRFIPACAGNTPRHGRPGGRTPASPSGTR